MLGSIAMLGGCSAATESHEHIVYFHKPADVQQAVNRLTEIHDQLVADGPIPEPREFHAHGHDHGDSGHGHSHSHHGHSHSHHDHGHDHGEEEIVTVGIFEEWNDIVRWLPSIAADSDLSEAEWKRINSCCDDLSNLGSGFEGDTPDTEKRDQFRENAGEIKRCLTTLQNTVSENEQLTDQSGI